MGDSEGYDTDLTTRIRAEFDERSLAAPEEASELARLWGRLNGEFQGLLSDPIRRERIRALLQPPSSGTPSAGSARPLPGLLGEIAELSARLDGSDDPSEGFVLAESVADQAHLLAHTVEGFRAALDPAAAITDAFHRFAALLSQLLRNAIEKMRAFAHLLHVTSFTVTFASTPPQVSVAFTFDPA
ncbi:MAG: hypothetical protein L3K01_00310 [Thermoplasmata archaeon]|nr:hypothetical protein [Thermoplasmata archaeon]MCI4332167.1 hypothetical protein [Thermoplasmata archaeon]